MALCRSLAIFIAAQNVIKEEFHLLPLPLACRSHAEIGGVGKCQDAKGQEGAWVGGRDFINGTWMESE